MAKWGELLLERRQEQQAAPSAPLADGVLGRGVEVWGEAEAWAREELARIQSKRGGGADA